MGRPKRLYPLGKFRLRVPKQPERDKGQGSPEGGYTETGESTL